MTDKKSAKKRQEAIKELLSEVLVSDHHKMIELLNLNYGIVATQPVVSRDLRMLGAIKKEINKEFFYALPNYDATNELLKLAILDIQYNESMIVVKTRQGLAAFVGDYVDQNINFSILGCLAGENVVFISCKSNVNIKENYEILCKKLNFRLIGKNMNQATDKGR